MKNVKTRFITADQKALQLYKRFITVNDLDRMRKIDNYITKNLLYPSAFTVAWENGVPQITWANPKFNPQPLKLEENAA